MSWLVGSTGGLFGNVSKLNFMEGIVPRDLKLTGGNPAPSASHR